MWGVCFAYGRCFEGHLSGVGVWGLLGLGALDVRGVGPGVAALLCVGVLLRRVLQMLPPGAVVWGEVVEVTGGLLPASAVQHEAHARVTRGRACDKRMFTCTASPHSAPPMSPTSHAPPPPHVPPLPPRRPLPVG